MYLTPKQICLAAVYLTNDQIIQLFDVTNMDIHEAFMDMDRPTPDLRLLIDLMDSATEVALGITKAQVVQLSRRIDELYLSVRARRCLTGDPDSRLRPLGLTYIWQVCEMSESTLLKTRNFGSKSRNEVRELLEEIGLGFNMDLTAIKDRLPQPPPK